MVEASENIPTSFKVHERLCIVIGNANYQAAREKVEGSELIDLQPALTDAEVFNEGIQRYGFDAVTTLKNIDVEFKRMGELLRGAKTKMDRNFEEGKNTLLVVYYAGHGMMKNTVYALTTDGKLFPLESMLRNYAS